VFTLQTLPGYDPCKSTTATAGKVVGFSLHASVAAKIRQLQVFYSIRSERLLCEQLDYNLIFRLRHQSTHAQAHRGMLRLGERGWPDA
jgi:hypothetical protein